MLQIVSSGLGLVVALWALPVHALSVEFFSIDTGVSRVDGVLDGPTPYFIELSAEGTDATSVSVTLPDGVTAVDLEDEGGGFFAYYQAFADLSTLSAAFPNGSYAFLFDEGETDEDSVTVSHALSPTSDFADILAPSGPLVEIPTAISWACAAATCNGDFVGWSIVDPLGEEIFFDFGAPSTTSVAIPAGLIQLGVVYGVDVDVLRATSETVDLGSGEADYFNVYASANSTLFVVPEPGTLGLLGIGLLALVALRR